MKSGGGGLGKGKPRLRPGLFYVSIRNAFNLLSTMGQARLKGFGVFYFWPAFRLREGDRKSQAAIGIAIPTAVST